MERFKSTSAISLFAFGDVTICFSTMEALRKREPVVLTTMEFKTLHSREKLLDQVFVVLALRARGDLLRQQVGHLEQKYLLIGRNVPHSQALRIGRLLRTRKHHRWNSSARERNRDNSIYPLAQEPILAADCGPDLRHHSRATIH